MNSKFEMKTIRCGALWAVAIALLLLAGCTIYDNYDIDLMEDAVAVLESSSSEEPCKDGDKNCEAESSSSEKEKVSSSETKESSSSEKESVRSSSSKGKDTTYVVIVNPSSGNEKSSSSTKAEPTSSENTKPKSSSSEGDDGWVCGDSTLTHNGFEYKTVLVKDKCWTKENMRHAPSAGKTICYDLDDANCEKYGRMYNYDAAEHACPKGWRLPTEEDFNEAIYYATGDYNYDEVGENFKSTSGWSVYNGDDLLGLSVLPSGFCQFDEFDEEPMCGMLTDQALLWTSDEATKNKSHNAWKLFADDNTITKAALDNPDFAVVRCIKK